MSILKVDAIRHNSATSDAITMASDGTCTAKITGITGGGTYSNRNKIINGDFTIHQRGGTIASSSGNYTIDRWRTYRSGGASGGFSVQQSLTSYPQTNISGVIDNFKASALITVTSAGSADSGNNCKFQQRIEGSNVYDLAFGTVAAKKVTVSFYVKCSLTGDFGVALVNEAHNRSNVQLYTVNSASTWERKVITFDGDTSGSWDFGTGTGLQLMFDMGSGSSKHAGSTNTWLSGEYHGTTSSVKLIHTNGATMQYAGVQLETGSVATSFEHRSISEELLRCQRYFKRFRGPVGGGGGYGSAGDGAVCTMANWTNTAAYALMPLGVEMRYAPKLTGFANLNYFSAGNTWAPPSSSQCYLAGSSYDRVELTLQGMSNMSQGNAGWLRIDNPSGYMDFDAEL